jgi:hypothetical protein
MPEERAFTLTFSTRVRLTEAPENTVDAAILQALQERQSTFAYAINRELLWGVKNFLDDLLQHQGQLPVDTDIERLAAQLAAGECQAPASKEQIFEMWDRIDTVINNTIDVSVASSIDFVAGETR